MLAVQAVWHPDDRMYLAEMEAEREWPGGIWGHLEGNVLAIKYPLMIIDAQHI